MRILGTRIQEGDARYKCSCIVNGIVNGIAMYWKFASLSDRIDRIIMSYGGSDTDVPRSWPHFTHCICSYGGVVIVWVRR